MRPADACRTGANAGSGRKSLTGDHDNGARERIDSDRPGYPRRATCKLSASAVEWRASSAEEALHRGFRRHSRSVAVAHSVMSKAQQLEIGRLRATPLGDWQQVVDLQQMGRGAATPGERIAITAASTVALPDVAPDSRGNVAPRRGLVAAVNRFAGQGAPRPRLMRRAVRRRGTHHKCRLRRRSGDRRARHACARREASRRGAARCSGRRAARSAVRGHTKCRLRRRSGDGRARHGGAGMGAIRQGAGRELRRRSSGGRARSSAACAGAIQQCRGRRLAWWSSVGQHRDRILPFGSDGVALRRRSSAASAPSRGPRHPGGRCPVRRPRRGFVFALSRPDLSPGRTGLLRCPSR